MITACNYQPHWPMHGQTSLAALDLIDPNSICTVDGPSIASASFWMLLSAGLLTGLSHCVGMCGPLVGTFAARRRAQRQEISTPLVLFQLGRLTSYMALGAGLGSAGYLFSSAVHNWQGIFSIGLGLVVVLLGLSLIGILPLQRHLSSIKLARFVGYWLKRFMNSSHPAAPFGLGVANGLLPCGPVYTLSLLAAMSGDPLKGAGLMLIFGLGTLPLMLGVGFSVSLLSVRLRSNLYRLAAILVVGVGLQLTLRGLALGGQISHLAIGAVMLW
jgi:sulfite exporter TauE/SafE